MLSCMLSLARAKPSPSLMLALTMQQRPCARLDVAELLLELGLGLGVLLRNLRSLPTRKQISQQITRHPLRKSHVTS